MAYNFDEAYSTDSFENSDWESICRHVGVNFTEEECDEQIEGSKTERKKQKCETGRYEGDEHMEGRNTEMKKRNSENGKEKGDQNDVRRGCEEEAETVQIKSDDLRTEMKNLRKILKRGRSVLLNPSIDDLNETYQMFKKSSKIIKKQWKALLKGDEGNPVEETVDVAEVHPCVEDRAREREGMGEGKIACEEDKKKKKKKKDTLNQGEIMFDTWNEGKRKQRKKEDKRDGDIQKVKEKDTEKKGKINPANDKPIFTSFQGHPRYLCPSCDFIGRSYGKAFGHMVEMHNVRVLDCDRCSFSTKNPTSLHNHRKLYCPKRNDK